MKGGWLLLGFWLCWPGGVGQAAAQIVPEEEGIAREDLQDVLAAFEEAGQESYLDAASLEDAEESGPWLQGKVRFWSLIQEGEQSWQARARIRSRGLVLRAKMKPGQTEASAAALAVGWEGDGWQLRAGGMGLTTGYGLLLSDPGRRGGLEAGSSFGAPAVRLRGWSSSPEERSVFGGGIQLFRGSWRLTAVQGAPEKDRPGPGYAALVVERRRESLGWALAGVQAQGGLLGVSFSGTAAAPEGRLGWEFSGRQDSPGAPWAGAWLVTGRWDPARRTRAEFQVAGSTSEEGPFTGQRPAVLKTWGGLGWALRFTSPLNTRASVALLLAHSRGNRLESQARRYARDTGEILLRYRPARGWSAMVRARSRRESKWAWSEDHPWLPAQLVAESPQHSLMAQLERRSGGGLLWRVAWRRLETGQGAARGRRSLLEIKGSRDLGGGLTARGHQMWAWGQPVDLVTAITPVPGMVRPRHWGQWSAETVLGLAWTRGPLVLATGLSRRLAGPENQEGDEMSIWLHGKVFW